jgi:6-phosphofructokinase 2
MKSFDIVTLTVSPALDKALISGLVPEQNSLSNVFDAGGGGINVSKAISRLEGKSLAVITSGGSTGEMLKKLLQEESISLKPLKHEVGHGKPLQLMTTMNQFRFVFPSPPVTIAEKIKSFQLFKN